MFEEFELNQARDANKKKLCEEHNVPIIYIANKEYCNGIDIFEISELLNQIELYTKQKIG